jgi:mannosyl-3-phosphoglycerate phosphatase
VDVSRVALVATDLDGTLLDAATYGFEPARPALEALRRAGVPLVLCSSKTRAEMEALAAAIGADGPLVVENGGAIVEPGGDVVVLGAGRETLVAALPGIAREAGARVRSFAQMSAPELAALTGLAEEQAALALRREYDEPFLVEEADGSAPDVDERLARAARSRGLVVSRGGRFHHLTGPADKGTALHAILETSPPRGDVVGLGDAANDLPLLRAATRPIVVPRPDGTVDPALAAALPGAERAPGPGPAGWAAAVLAALAGGALAKVGA